MSVEQIMHSLSSLSQDELKAVSIYVRQLRSAADLEHRKLIATRLDDKDPSHWVSLEELKSRFPGEWPNG